MKKLFLVLAVLPAVLTAGDFGKEADKSSVTAKKSLMVMRTNPKTGEKVFFNAASVDIKKLNEFAKVEEGNAAKTDFLASAIDKIEESQKGTTLVAKSEAGSSPTTAYYGYYYGGYYVTYYRVTYYYYPVYYYPVYYGGYYYVWYY